MSTSIAAARSIIGAVRACSASMRARTPRALFQSLRGVARPLVRNAADRLVIDAEFCSNLVSGISGVIELADFCGKDGFRKARPRWRYSAFRLQHPPNMLAARRQERSAAGGPSRPDGAGRRRHDYFCTADSERNAVSACRESIAVSGRVSWRATPAFC
jgi:hypothetical protein